MVCLFIPLVYGINTKLSQDPEAHGRAACPRCHNNSLSALYKRKRFDLCYVPLIPLGKKPISWCDVCQYSAKREPGAALPVGAGHDTKGAQAQRGGYDVGYH